MHDIFTRLLIWSQLWLSLVSPGCAALMKPLITMMIHFVICVYQITSLEMWEIFSVYKQPKLLHHTVANTSKQRKNLAHCV